MFKFSKLLLISALSFLTLGVVVGTINLAKNDFSFKKSIKKYEIIEKSYQTSLNNINSIEIDIKEHMVLLESTNEAQLKVTYYESEEYNYEFKEENNCLTINSLDTRKWYDYIGINYYDNKIVKIEIPSSFTKTIIINNHKKTTIKNLNLEKLQVDITNGDLNIDSSNINNIDINIKDGDIMLDNVLSNLINAKTLDGDIELNILLCPTIILETKDGDIEGSIKGNIADYIIFSEAKDGENNLIKNKVTGTKNLTIINYDGDIEIYFID